jgi:hypothetical protein
MLVLPLGNVIGAEISDRCKPAPGGYRFQFEFERVTINRQDGVGTVSNTVRRPLKVEQIDNPVFANVVLRRHLPPELLYFPELSYKV